MAKLQFVAFWTECSPPRLVTDFRPDVGARGRFKTFTEDAPLLGKHMGTYWWGWQVRGQEGSGVMEKTYTFRSRRR